MKLRLPESFSRRAIAISVTIAIELLILLALLTLGTGGFRTAPDRPDLTTFDATEPSADPAEEQEEEQSQDEPETSAPVTQQPQQSAPTPFFQPPSAFPRPSPSPIPQPTPQPSAAPQPTPSPTPSATSSIGAVVRPGANVGPPNTGRRGPPDTQVVGTAPDGSPLYAAQWYREPNESETSGYLSTATGPGWGLIACKTAPDWRVEDCVIVGENPGGSGIARATLAASWQFLVRPPRLDGEYQVGAWVRIRMNYGAGRGPQG